MSITLDTHDGGKTWTSSTASLFGQIARVRMSPAGVGLGLIAFTDNFEWPSEVFRIDWKGGKSTRVFRDHNRKHHRYGDRLRQARVPGRSRDSGQTRSRRPIPGKLKIYKSTDLEHLDRDGSATIGLPRRSAAFRRRTRHNIWVATDTGMILKLMP